MIQNASSREPRCFGFTLVELLAALLVVAVLASLALSAVGASKSKARDLQCINNLRVQAVALLSFVSTYGVYPLSGNSDAKYTEHKASWQNSILADQLMILDRLKCPAAVMPPLRVSEGFVHYGYNDRGVIGSQDQEPLGLGGNGKWPKRAPPVAESEVISPATTIAILDAAQAWNGLIEDGLTAYSGRYFYAEGTEDGNSRMMRRHNGFVQITFSDGHVSKDKVRTVFIDRSSEGLRFWNRDGLPHLERLAK